MTPRSRNCYDTTLVYLFISGNENILPSEIVNSIPDSTKATWRTYSKEKFVGHAQSGILDEGIKKTQLYAKYKHIRKVLTAVESIYTTISDMLDLVKTPIYQIKRHKETVINLIQQYRLLIPLDKLLDCFRISRSTYQNWILELNVKCSSSYMELCVRKYGSQLLKPQVEIIKKALCSEEYKHWPVASIAYHFQRTNQLHVSVTTWYKYLKLLGIKKLRIKNTKN